MSSVWCKYIKVKHVPSSLHLRWSFCFLSFFLLVWELNGNVLWSFLMSTCGSFSSVEHWQTHTHIHTSNRTPPPVFTRVTGHPEIYIHGWKWKWNNQEGGVLLCYHQLLRCTGGERVTFNSVKMRGLRPACSRCTGTYRNSTDGL